MRRMVEKTISALVFLFFEIVGNRLSTNLKSAGNLSALLRFRISESNHLCWGCGASICCFVVLSRASGVPFTPDGFVTTPGSAGWFA